jgi:hypothetical protein
MASVSADLNAAVSMLMAERPSRGALGPLPLGLSGVARVEQQRRATVRKVDRAPPSLSPLPPVEWNTAAAGKNELPND